MSDHWITEGMDGLLRTQPISYPLTQPPRDDAEHAAHVARDQAFMREQNDADPLPVTLIDFLPDDWLSGAACIVTFACVMTGFVFAPRIAAWLAKVFS